MLVKFFWVFLPIYFFLVILTKESRAIVLPSYDAHVDKVKSNYPVCLYVRGSDDKLYIINKCESDVSIEGQIIPSGDDLYFGEKVRAVFSGEEIEAEKKWEDVYETETAEGRFVKYWDLNGNFGEQEFIISGRTEETNAVEDPRSKRIGTLINVFLWFCLGILLYLLFKVLKKSLIKRN